MKQQKNIEGIVQNSFVAVAREECSTHTFIKLSGFSEEFHIPECSIRIDPGEKLQLEFDDEFSIAEARVKMPGGKYRTIYSNNAVQVPFDYDQVQKNLLCHKARLNEEIGNGLSTRAKNILYNGIPIRNRKGNLTYNHVIKYFKNVDMGKELRKLMGCNIRTIREILTHFTEQGIFEAAGLTVPELPHLPKPKPYKSYNELKDILIKVVDPTREYSIRELTELLRNTGVDINSNSLGSKLHFYHKEMGFQLVGKKRFYSPIYKRE